METKLQYIKLLVVLIYKHFGFYRICKAPVVRFKEFTIYLN